MDGLLGGLSDDECRAVLVEVVRQVPAAGAVAEEVARGLLTTVDRAAIAEDVAAELTSMPHTDLASRSGRQPGGFYVEPTEAAWELLAEVIEPWIEDVERRARLGMHDSAMAVAVGVIEGLARCSPIRDGTVLAWAPDAPIEFTREVSHRAAAAGVVVEESLLSEAARSWFSDAT